MPTMRHALVTLCAVLAFVCAHADPPASPGLKVSVADDPPGHLFTPGKPISLTVRVINNGAAQDVTLNAYLSTGTGCPAGAVTVREFMTDDETIERAITFPGSERYPNGPYRVDIAALGQHALGSISTMAGIWNGPATTRNDRFGVAYTGPLADGHTWKDLDLFAQAGAKWMRFPLHGWLPGADLPPVQIAECNLFIQEATRRDFRLLAAFTPEVTVDRAVNPVQADREYYESLGAAAARYGGRVPIWELLQVRPDPAFLNMKGVGFSQIAQGREALRKVDPKLQALYSFEGDFATNAKELFHYKLPGVGDLMGMRYNFGGIPENTEQSTPPPQALGDVLKSASTLLRKGYNDPVWVTEYGFDQSKAERLPHAVHQAALMARALTIARAGGIERAFWRHEPGSPYDLPFTNDDGSALPSLLALRTTLQMLNGAVLERDMSVPALGIRAYLFRYPGPGKRDPADFMFAAWCEKQPAALSLRTDALNMPVFDPWGNAIELKPQAGIALLQIDENPRFVQLGRTARMEIFPSFVQLIPSRPLLKADGEGLLVIKFSDEERRLFRKAETFKVLIQSWPDRDIIWQGLKSPDPKKPLVIPINKILEQTIVLDPPQTAEVRRYLPLPANARKGMVYQISIDIMVESRLVGHLEVPVWLDK
jgi:hypothetical protein